MFLSRRNPLIVFYSRSQPQPISKLLQDVYISTSVLLFGTLSIVSIGQQEVLRCSCASIASPHPIRIAARCSRCGH